MDLDPDGVRAWLESPDGVAWQRERYYATAGGWSRGTWLAQLLDCNPAPATCSRMSGPTRPQYDPCGRPPLGVA